MKITSQIWNLLALILSGEASEKDRHDFESWLAEAPENPYLFEELKAISEQSRPTAKFQTKDIEEAWAQVKAQTLGRKKKIVPFRKFVKYAAAAFLILGISAVILMQQKKITPTVEFSESTVKPGKSKAILILDDGKEIGLTDEKINLSTKGVQIQNNASGLRYIADNKITESVINKLIVPKGGEYPLTLSDGTKIWLNSESEITYPAPFSGEIRKVNIISGEVYFEVAKDTAKPFIVSINNKAEVEVLGTHFNVNAYHDEAAIKTTLVEGSVKVSSLITNDRSLITPGQQAGINEGGYIEVKEVDTKLYTSWKDGQFYFNDCTLEALMHSLSRWYDFEVDYEDESLKGLRFTGLIEKHNPIEYGLKLISYTTVVSFKIVGNAIIVKK